MNHYKIGQSCEVHSFGRWYPGTVTRLGRTRIFVTYTTGTGVTRTKPFPMTLVWMPCPCGHRCDKGNCDNHLGCAIPCKLSHR